MIAVVSIFILTLLPRLAAILCLSKHRHQNCWPAPPPPLITTSTPGLGRSPCLRGGLIRPQSRLMAQSGSIPEEGLKYEIKRMDLSLRNVATSQPRFLCNWLTCMLEVKTGNACCVSEVKTLQGDAELFIAVTCAVKNEGVWEVWNYQLVKHLFLYTPANISFSPNLQTWCPFVSPTCLLVFLSPSVSDGHLVLEMMRPESEWHHSIQWILQG